MLWRNQGRFNNQTYQLKSNKTKIMLCFLCESSGNVKKFTADRLEKCFKILAYRKKKKIKYQYAQLPKSLYEKGYHLDCYDLFTVLRGKHRKEFGFMRDNGATLDSGKHTASESPESFSEDEDTPLSSYTTNQNSIETDIEIPEPLEDSIIKTELEEEPQIDTSDMVIVEHDIKKELKEFAAIPELSIPSVDNPSEAFKMDIVPSYITPDISKAVILKSILTRKAPIKKDMANDSLLFNYGMDFLKSEHKTRPVDQDAPVETLGLKIITTTTLSDTGVCLFCNKKERKIGTQREFSMKSKKNIYENVVSCAKGLYDYDLIEKLKYSKSFPYHALCRTEYRNRHEKLNRKNCDEQDWLVFKKLHVEAFEGLCAFIDDKIIDKRKAHFLSDLYERYKALLHEIQNSPAPFEFTSYSPQNLQEKIVNRYFGIIEVTTSKILKRKVVYKSDIKTNFDSAVVENEDLKYDKLAFELRNAIKSMKPTALGGQSDVYPEKFVRFVGSLIQGPDIRRINHNDGCDRIKSMCEEIVGQVMKED